MPEKIILCKDPAALAEQGAEIIIESAQEAITARGVFNIALSGGSTPEHMFQLLAAPARRGRIDWAHVRVFVGDERYVPTDDPRSNFGMAKRALLDHVPLDPAHLFSIDSHIQPIQSAARAYEAVLARELGSPPVFDLALQGMGDDGHTASLFPHSANLVIENEWVVDSAPGILPPPVDRVTITLPVINAARKILFLIAGASKAAALKDVLENGASKRERPSAGIQPTSGELIWLLDEAAASQLSSKTL